MSPARAAASPGTRPEGIPVEQAAGHVRGMFDRIAPTYDRANHLLSLSIDRYWRRQTVRLLRRRLTDSHPNVLDICCGTGDLSLALARGLGPQAQVIGADFSHAMLKAAGRKAPALGWFEADALHLPWAEETFSGVATGFGFRNLTDYQAGLREFLRVLRPGGILAILECSRPPIPGVAQLYGFYFERVLPRLGGWISGDDGAYRYLPSSVSRFPEPPELAGWMREAGYTDVSYRRFTGGIAALHLGTKPR